MRCHFTGILATRTKCLCIMQGTRFLPNHTNQGILHNVNASVIKYPYHASQVTFLGPSPYKYIPPVQSASISPSRSLLNSFVFSPRCPSLSPSFPLWLKTQKLTTSSSS